MMERLNERLKAAFSRDDGTRLLASMVLATMLWGWVSLVTDPEVTQTFGNLTIQADPLESDLLLVTPLPTISVRLTGPESVIEDVSTSEITVSIDTASIDEPGLYALPIRVQAPDGVRRKQPSQSTVSVEVEQTRTANFDLQYDYPDLAENDSRQVGQLRPEVSQVTVSGPASDVERVVQVELPIEIGARTQEFTDTFVPVALDADGVEVPEVTITPERIEVTVPVSQRGRSVAVLAETQGTPAEGYEIVDRRINPPTVLVDGPAEVLSSSITVLTEPVALEGATRTVTQRVPLDPDSLPAEVVVIQPADGMVEVTIQIDQRGVNQTLPDQAVVPIGLAPGLAATIEPASVAVSVVATESQLAALEATDITIGVDLAGLGPGTYVLMPAVSVPANMRWVQTDPARVTVTIQPAGAAQATPEGTPRASPEAGARRGLPVRVRA